MYIYGGDIYCEQCGKEICKQCISEGFSPPDLNDESSYDSDEFPKGPYLSSEADSPQHCGSGEDCCNAIKLPSGRKIGAWLENDLTIEGIKYVHEAIQDCGELAELWSEYYEWDL